ncbi:MMPL family transporter [Micromonospora sp. NBC_00860]|uniref:MMPL family transporter n=1 Tax=Micromonospora sp. NBC_00860 TaxID=2975980 RepID=UPI00386C3A1A
MTGQGEVGRRRSLAALLTGRRSAFVVVCVWLGLVVVATVFAGRLGDVQRDDRGASLPASAESTHVLDRQRSFVATASRPAIVVYERAAGLTAADRNGADSDARAFAQRTDLAGQIIGPVLSSDGRAAQITIPLEPTADARDAVDSIGEVAQHERDGLAVYVTGPAGAAADQRRAIAGLDTTLLLATLAVVVVILLVTYRSPVLWLIPVGAAGVALTCAQAVVYLLARHADLTVTADGAAILTILVFGASTDYALLLIARYREELHRHGDRHAAMRVALRRSAPAVTASALTVAAGMLCLLLADTGATRALGPVFAIGIVVGLAVMLTLFPALLVTMGRWVFWPVVPALNGRDAAAPRLWVRLGALVARRPRLTWALTALVLAALSTGVLRLDATGLSGAESFRGAQDSFVGAEVLGRHFPAGAGSPLVVVSDRAAGPGVRAALAGTPGVQATTVTEPVLNGEHAYLEGTLTDPADSAAAYATVDRVRIALRQIPNARAQVGGDTAVKLDGQRAAQHDRRVIVPIVCALIFLILVALLRSLIAPLVLTATVVLSFGAALGVSALIFRHVFGFAGTDSSFPLFVFVFLVSLGIDYNIFLMTRVREETVRHGTRRATLIGLTATGGVITSAGIVLAGTFAVLTVLPLTQFVELGFAVALGILLDTIVVRSILVTALTIDLDRWIWWPGRLHRYAPKGGVEVH